VAAASNSHKAELPKDRHVIPGDPSLANLVLLLALLDCELRAIEAENHAQSASQFSIARNWRDIAQGYRLLADFVANAQANYRHGEPGDRRSRT